MPEQIPDFNDTELWVIREEVDIQNAATELRLDPSDRELTLCPVVYWKEQAGEKIYRNQFFYNVRDQYDTNA